jgi:hypothetical protein
MCIFLILFPAGKVRLAAGAVLLKSFPTSFWGSQTNVIAYTHAIQCFMVLFRWIDFTVIHDPECDFCLVGCLVVWLMMLGRRMILEGNPVELTVHLDHG